MANVLNRPIIIAGGGGVKALFDATQTCKSLFENKQITYEELDEILSYNDTANVTNMMYMFRSNYSSLTAIPLLNTSNATNLSYWCEGCRALTTFPAIDTSNATDINCMCQNCTSLTTVPVLNTSKATDMRMIFQNCTSLTTVQGLDISSCTNMYAAFSGCSKLESITFTNETPCSIVESTFQGCTSLTEIKVPTFEAYLAYCEAWGDYIDISIITTDDKGLASIDNQSLAIDGLPSKDITIKYFGSSATLTAVSDSASICGASISGNVLTITAEGEGTANITVTMTSGEETLTQTFSVDVLESIPESTYSVEAIDGVTYGFTLNDSGYYESTCQGISNGFSLCKVVINASGFHTMYLDCINSGESSYDFGILSNLDTTLTTSYYQDTSNVFKSFKGLSSTEVQTVDYGVIEAGEHYIYVKYIKDNSGNSGNDSLQFQVRFEL